MAFRVFIILWALTAALERQMLSRANQDTAAVHPCGDDCACTIETSCGCIEEAPVEPVSPTPAPAPVTNRIDMAIPPTMSAAVLCSRDVDHAAPGGAAQRRPGERAIGQRMDDALALKGVWRT